MANFKASSGFVLGTTVLLLLVVISIYGAPVATACSDKVMLFNSSSLEVVEQVAKDQGITELAAIDYHEIQRRVLRGSLAEKFVELSKGLTDLFDKAVKPFKETDHQTMELTTILLKFCKGVCLKSGPSTANNCSCQNRDSKKVLRFAKSASICGELYTIYYCCNTATTGRKCNLCCGTK